MKRKTTFLAKASIMLLAVLFSFTGARAQQALPYEYGFEDGDVTTDGWIANISSGSSGIKTGGPEHSGSYGFAFNYSESNASLISPLLTGGDNGVDVSFWYKEYSSQYGNEQFQVGYTTDEMVTNADEFIYGDVITASTDWQEYSNSFPAGTKRIAVKYIYNDCWFLFLDDFSFEGLSSCVKPTDLTITNITTDEALVSWTSDGDLFNLRYKASSESEWTTIEGIDKGTSYPLDLLTPATPYDVQVQSVCSSTEQSAWVAASFTTDCPEFYAIPYAYGFENANDMNCWTQIDTELTDGYYNTSGNMYTKTGDGCYYFSSYSGSTEPQYLISPLLSGITNGLHVEFWYRKGPNGEESFMVGYSTTNNDPESFTWGEEITSLTATYQRFSANYPAETKYVAVKYTGSDSYYVFLDDFLFEESASVLEPTGVHVADETTESASISWTPGASETAWDLYVTNDPTDVPDETTTPTIENTSDNPYSLTSLTPATYYYVYVRANTGTETSAWSSPAAFNTKALPMALPYNYAFDDDILPIGWTTINTNASYCSLNVMDPTGSSGNNVLAFYRGSSSGTLVAVLPEVDAAYPLKGYQISFDACYANSSGGSMTSGKLGIGIMTDPEDFSTFELIEEVDITDGYSTFGSYEVWLNSYTGSGCYIAIQNIYTQSGYVLIDNIAVTELPSVLRPTDLAVANIAETSAELSWTANSGETEWTVYYKKSADTDYTEITGVTDNPYTLTGLEASTDYDFYVVAVSGSETSAPSEVYSFKTTAAPIVSFPWTEDFNSLTVASSIPDGWDNSEGTVTGVAYKWCYNTNTTGNGATTGTSYDGSNCVRFNSFNTSVGQYNFLKTLPISLPSDPAMQLTFWYKNPAGGDFSVYISTDGGATHETALATGLTGVTDWTKAEPINLSAYAGQTVVIAFKGTSNYGNGNAYIYLDDVTVEEVPACAAPTALSVTNITTNSAELSWTANSGETEWTIYYKKVADTDYTEVTGVTENPYTLTGLASSSNYVFYVVAHKGTDTSAPSSTCSFTTDCDVFIVDAANPFFEGFEDTSFAPACWTNVSTVANGSTRQWSKSTSYHHSGSGSAYSNYYGDIYLKLPTMQVDGDALLSFWSYNVYAGDYEKNSVVLFDGSDEIELWSPSSVTSQWVNTVIDLSAYNGQTINLAFKYEGNNAHGWYIDDVQIVVPTDLVLDNNASDNSDYIDDNNGNICNVQITGRTLYQNNEWNTICLPFALDATQIAASPLVDADIRTLNNIAINGDIVTMNFTDAGAITAIEAGKPYIVKWASGSGIVDPTFTGVTINNTTKNVECISGEKAITFKGTYDLTTFSAENLSILFIGAGNTLSWPLKGARIGAFRGYFKLTGITADSGSGVKIFTNLDDDATGISFTPTLSEGEGDWYDLSGRKLGSKPSMKGIYVNGGRKVTIK